MASDLLVNTIREQADLVVIASQHISLQASRRMYKGQCPFHKDHGLSLMISPSSNTFKCFGCGEEGDQITFVMKIRNLSFDSAVAYLSGQMDLGDRLSA